MRDRTWKRDVGQAVVPVRLGAVVRNGRCSPCPACGSTEPRAVSVRGNLWRCHRCEAGGDGLGWAMWACLGKGTAAPGDWPALRSWCAERGLCEPEPETYTPAPVRPEVVGCAWYPPELWTWHDRLRRAVVVATREPWADMEGALAYVAAVDGMEAGVGRDDAVTAGLTWAREVLDRAPTGEGAVSSQWEHMRWVERMNTMARLRERNPWWFGDVA